MRTIVVYLKNNTEGTRHEHHDVVDVVRDGVLSISYRKSNITVLYPLHNVLKWDVRS
jgi:hypothetical protein